MAFYMPLAIYISWNIQICLTMHHLLLTCLASILEDLQLIISLTLLSGISVFHTTLQIPHYVRRNVNRSVWSTRWRQPDCFSKASYFWNPYTTILRHIDISYISKCNNAINFLFFFIFMLESKLCHPKECRHSKGSGYQELIIKQNASLLTSEIKTHIQTLLSLYPPPGLIIPIPGCIVFKSSWAAHQPFTEHAPRRGTRMRTQGPQG